MFWNSSLRQVQQIPLISVWQQTHSAELPFAPRASLAGIEEVHPDHVVWGPKPLD